MTDPIDEIDISQVAQTLLESFDSGRSLDTVSLPASLNLAVAKTIQRDIIARRRARGERTVGYKIGFTNRTIWGRYGVHHPIWSPMFDTTVTELDSTAAAIDLARFAEPRLEPEIVVRLARTPDAATPLAVAMALDWVTHGFEIVQSPFPEWRFTGAQAFAAQGLHGALLVGPRHQVATLPSATSLSGWLAGLQLRLYRDRAVQPVDEGVGANVLDGPLHAIAHLANAMHQDGEHLQTGDIITTGTITDAQVLQAGQYWQSQIDGIAPIGGLHLTVTST